MSQSWALSSCYPASTKISTNLSVALSAKFSLTIYGLSSNILSSLRAKSYIKIIHFFINLAEYYFSLRMLVRKERPSILPMNSRLLLKFSALRKLLNAPSTASLFLCSCSSTNFIIKLRAPHFNATYCGSGLFCTT